MIIKEVKTPISTIIEVYSFLQKKKKKNQPYLTVKLISDRVREVYSTSNIIL